MPSLFYALFPPPDLTHRIIGEVIAHQALAALTVRSIAPERLHITVAYLGDRGDDEQCIADARNVLERFDAVPVDAELSTLRTFGDARVRPVVLTGAFDNPWVTELRALLLPDLNHAGIAVHTAHEFVPHMTLAYAEVDVQPAAVGPFCFRCSDIALVRGGDYAVLARRPLNEPPDGPFGAWFRDPTPTGRILTPEELDERRSFFRR